MGGLQVHQLYKAAISVTTIERGAKNRQVVYVQTFNTHVLFHSTLQFLVVAGSGDKIMDTVQSSDQSPCLPSQYLGQIATPRILRRSKIGGPVGNIIY